MIVIRTSFFLYRVFYFCKFHICTPRRKDLFQIFFGSITTGSAVWPLVLRANVVPNACTTKSIYICLSVSTWLRKKRSSRSRSFYIQRYSVKRMNKF